MNITHATKKSPEEILPGKMMIIRMKVQLKDAAATTATEKEAW